MLKRVLATLAAVFGIVVVALGAASASASATTHQQPSHINGCSVTPAGDLTFTVTVKNDKDSGAHGDWAVDNFTRITQFHKSGKGVWLVSVTDQGTFTTLPGALSPGNGVTLPIKPATGSFTGNANFTVHSDSAPSCKDVPDIITGTPGTSTWPERFFCKITKDCYTFDNWSWTYELNCKSLGLEGNGNVSWLDGNDGLTGDINLGAWTRLCHKHPKPCPSSASPSPSSPSPSPVSPSPSSASPSTSASSPSGSASPLPSSSNSTQPVSLVGNTGSSLPVTGTSLLPFVGLGLVLVVGGGVAIVLTRRRHAVK